MLRGGGSSGEGEQPQGRSEAACSRRHAAGGMQQAACSRRHAAGGMQQAACRWYFLKPAGEFEEGNVSGSRAHQGGRAGSRECHHQHCGWSGIRPSSDMHCKRLQQPASHLCLYSWQVAPSQQVHQGRQGAWCAGHTHWQCLTAAHCLEHPHSMRLHCTAAGLAGPSRATAAPALNSQSWSSSHARYHQGCRSRHCYLQRAEQVQPLQVEC
jgi:hypothetical protein